MKKYLSLLSIPFMMALNSCLQEDIVKNNGQEISAKVSIIIPENGAQSRAVSGPTTELSGMRLFLAIYNGDEIVKTIDKTNVDFNQTVTEDIRLVAGKTYKIAAWADFGSEYYTINGGTVTLQDNQVTGNNSKNDAYYAFDEDVTLDATNTTVSLNLKRPFGLAQVTTNDWNSITGINKPTTYSTTINVPTQLDLATGEASNPQNVTFTGAITDGNATTQMLSYDYILAGETQSELQNFTVTYSNGTTSEDITYEFNNIPVQRNYITNISGNILTKSADLNISIDKTWADIELGDSDNLRYVATNGGEITLISDCLFNDAFIVNPGAGKTVTINLNGKTIKSLNSNNDAIMVNSGTLIINGEGYVGGEEGYYAVWATGNSKVILNGGNYYGNGSCIQARDNATVEINDGYYKVGQAFNGVYFVINLQDNQPNTAIIKGGKFENFNPADTNTEPAGVSDNFVAEGYESTQISADPIIYEVTPIQ